MKSKPTGLGNLQILAAFALLLPAGASQACEGFQLEQTNALLLHFEFATQTCNETGSVQDAQACMQEEWGYNAEKIQSLPESCREMLREFEPAE